MDSHEVDGGARPTRILHVREIPKDIGQKDLEELFRGQEGYIATRKLTHFAFIEFETPEAATVAMREFQGHRFSNYDQPLVIAFDKDARESRKRKSPDSERVEGTRYRGPPPEREDFFRFRTPPTHGHGRDYHRREDPRGFPPGYPDFDPRRSRGHDAHTLPPSYYGDPYMLGPMRGMMPFPPTSHHHRDYHESTTLFVGSMPSDVTEREMSILFRFMAGCKSVRLVKRDNKPAICFVDFIDSACATVAMNYLQGYRLDKDCVGLSIEFDKGSKHEKENKERERAMRDRDDRRERSNGRDSDRERI